MKTVRSFVRVVLGLSVGGLTFGATWTLGGKWLRTLSAVTAACGLLLGADWTQIDGGLPRSQVGIYTVVVDSVTPSTLYSLTYAAGSIFRSTDSGATWTLLDGISSVQALAIDTGPTSTLYASSTLSGGAVLKSTDAGQTWSNTGLRQVQAGGLAVDPVNHGTVYALGDRAIYKTTDAGATWSAKTNGLPGLLLGRQLAFDAADPSILYAGFAASVYKSTDAGENWVQLTTGLPGGACGCLVVTDPTQSGTIFNIRFSPDNPAPSGNLFRLYKSADGGASWKPSDAGLPGYVLSVVFGADSSIYASWEGDSDAGGVVRSTDGGASWSPFRTGLPAVQGIWCLALAPGNSPALFAAFFDNYTGRGGVFKISLLNAGGDTNWTDSSSGLSYLNAHALVVDPLSSSTVYVAVADGIAKSVDSGSNWNPIDFPSPARATFVGGTAYVPSLLIDPTHPNTLFASFLSTAGCYYTDAFLRKSTDGGATWSDLGATYCATGPGVPLAMDPANSNTIFAAPQDSIDCGAYVFGTDDGGADWNQNAIGGGFITALAIAPTNPPALYAASNGSVLKSTDSASTWTDTGFPQLTPSQTVTAIAVDPSDGKILYVASSTELYKTTDAGATWKPLRSLTDSITALAIEPKSGALYVGTSTKGVFRSSDGGRDWIVIDGGLPSLNIQALAVSADGSGALYAITAGGVFRTVDSIERIPGRRRF